jgi:tetraacyldisaccharide 4'-kinase
MHQLLNEHFWLNAWYGKSRWTLWLLPLTFLFICLSHCRKYFLQKYKQVELVTPVIIVGNISLGGTGKTPLLIELVKWLQGKDFHPGVVSRGYGGVAPHYPYLVSATSSAAQVGDEPLLIYQRTQCAVCVGPDRVAAAKLLEDNHCDIILSDDGLQHYALGRDLEIAVVDGQRGLGNGWRLPVGPLRESVDRLTGVDWIVVNSPKANFTLPRFDSLIYVSMNVTSQQPIELMSNAVKPISTLIGKKVHAVAGIGNPERFFTMLKSLGVEFIPHVFPDHHAYQEQDFEFNDELPVIMTEKDAVKCRNFLNENWTKDNWFYLPIRVELSDFFWKGFEEKIERVLKKKKKQFTRELP